MLSPSSVIAMRLLARSLMSRRRRLSGCRAALDARGHARCAEDRADAHQSRRGGRTLRRRREADLAFAEVGYMEERARPAAVGAQGCGLQCESGVAGEPTAFVAEFGSGKPVIAILGEFDALPGLSQDVSPERKPIRAGAAGHGCGHHLFGTASVASAISLKQWMQANNVKGTLRMIGTPAEEGGAGKVYMVRDGVFNDVDAVIAWHPGDENSVTGERTMANISGKFRFHGVSSHAAAAPERGKSALDAVEAMDFMTNALREHIPDGSRIHYIITNGGKAPNVVPDEAEVYYYVRHVEMPVVMDIWGKVVNAAKGAAIGTARHTTCSSSRRCTRCCRTKRWRRSSSARSRRSAGTRTRPRSARSPSGCRRATSSLPFRWRTRRR